MSTRIEIPDVRVVEILDSVDPWAYDKGFRATLAVTFVDGTGFTQSHVDRPAAERHAKQVLS